MNREQQRKVASYFASTFIQERTIFSGLLNYYGKFIPNLATLIQLLNGLLQHDYQWKWSVECEAAFNQAKENLVSSKVLVHYDPITVATHVLAYRVEAAFFLPNIVVDGL